MQDDSKNQFWSKTPINEADIKSTEPGVQVSNNINPSVAGDVKQNESNTFDQQNSAHQDSINNVAFGDTQNAMSSGQNNIPESSRNQLQTLPNQGNYQQLNADDLGKKKRGFFNFGNKNKKVDSLPSSNSPEPVNINNMNTSATAPTMNASASPSGAIDPSQTGSKKPVKVLIIMLLFIIVSLLGILAISRRNKDVKEPTDTEGEITWWGVEDPEIYASVIKGFEESNPNTKVNYVQKPDENYREILVNSFARGAGPDMFTFHNSWMPMLRSQLDKMPGFVMSSEDFESTFYPVATADLARADGVYGIPLEYDAITLYINDEIFATAGKLPPEKWDELDTLSKELTLRDSRGLIIQSGAALGNTDNVDYWPEIIGFLIYQNHAVPSEIKTERAMGALRFYRHFSGNNIWSNILPNSTRAFANGDVAMFFGTAESASEILLQNPNLQFRTIFLPQLRTDDKEDSEITYASYLVQGVWIQSQHRGVAWNLLKYLSTPEVLREINSNAVDVKLVGDPYPRRDMASLQVNDKILGSVVSLAPRAKSWYLASMLHDGETGMNTKLAKQIQAILGSDFDEDAVNIAASKISNILIEYGLKAKPGIFQTK